MADDVIEHNAEQRKDRHDFRAILDAAGPAYMFIAAAGDDRVFGVLFQQDGKDVYIKARAGAEHPRASCLRRLRDHLKAAGALPTAKAIAVARDALDQAEPLKDGLLVLPVVAGR